MTNAETRIPAEGFPVWDYVAEELTARHWTRDDLARRMGGDEQVTRLVLDFMEAQPYFEDEMVAGMLLDPETALALERAFGVDAEMWVRLDAAYREWRAARPGNKRVEAS